ncbi:glycosyltransferase family 2 protein [Desulfoluna butyratoxydans]|uniref:Nucleotide-diphospho-sugar transferases n=1 Tax=Desulfoluna butyratoxydans TaxID=231438 RepID=A0A4U8YYY5_9BACT|nr:glycosyltransferase [Desulfoluna butyratoxydans]VFQ47462.1 nucleotide-diphospho-sugar transferases [Desulfoluna butyratoxydans]
MKDSEPLFSVAIVTQNRCQSLCRAIDSVYRQTYAPIEIVLVDNASSDNSVEVVRDKWPEIKIIRLHRNVGCQPGRNIAMMNCKGKYIFNLDDDGELDCRAIELMAARFELDEKLAVICCSTPPIENSLTAPREALNMSERWVGIFRGGASAIRSSILSETGYFPEFPRAGSEAVLSAYIIDNQYTILYYPPAIMYHPPARVGKVLKEHTFYNGWHIPKRAVLYLPWPNVLTEGLWGSIRGFVAAIQSQNGLAYLRGCIRFLLDLPNAISERKPISKLTVKKISFLLYNNIESKDDINKGSDFSLFKLVYIRWNRWRCS